MPPPENGGGILSPTFLENVCDPDLGTHDPEVISVMWTR